MTTMQVKDATNTTVAIEKPLPPGSTSDSASRPVAFSTEGKALFGAVTETVPASDTASSGLNGRLQRIAQRLTTLMALFPSALGANVSSNSLSVAQATDDVMIGSRTETAPTTDTASSGLNGRLQRIAQRVTSLITLIPAALTGGGNFAVAINEAIAAGTNLIGFFTATFSTPVIVKGSFTPATSYSQGASFGGLITAAGFGANAVVKIGAIRMLLGGTLTAAGGLAIYVFESAPSTTFTDGSGMTWNTADDAKVGAYVLMTTSLSQNGTQLPQSYNVGVVGTNGAAVKADGSGNIYLAFIATGTFTLTSPRASWRCELDK